MFVLVTTLAGCGDDPRPRPDAPSTSGTTTVPPPAPTASTPPPPSCEWLGTTPLRPTPDCPRWTLGESVALDTLTVEPGTELRVGPDVVITVRRWLHAEGTAEAPIAFRAATDRPWGGLDLAYDATGDEYGSHYPGGTEYRVTHLLVADAGAGRDAAITVTGGYESCGDYSCVWVSATLTADHLRVHGSASAGVAGDGRVVAVEPIGFARVEGPLLDVRPVNLATALVDDQGDNATPVVRVRGGLPDDRLTGRWPAQRVPIEVLEPLHVSWYQGRYDMWDDDLEIRPNVLRFAPGAGLTVTGGRVEAHGVTFEALDPTAPWAGLDGGRDPVGYTTDVYRAHLRGRLRLNDCTVSGAESPAIDWAEPRRPPVLRGTVVTEVAGNGAGDDVCVAGCADLTDATLGNVLDCSVPVACPP